MQVAERLRQSVAKTSIGISDKELQITVSIGVSRRDENTLELETLIARADQAMYIAKYRGAQPGGNQHISSLHGCAFLQVPKCHVKNKKCPPPG